MNKILALSALLAVVYLVDKTIQLERSNATLKVQLSVASDELTTLQSKMSSRLDALKQASNDRTMQRVDELSKKTTNTYQ